jgi:hypothetical protein
VPSTVAMLGLVTSSISLLCYWQAKSSIISEARERPILDVGKPCVSYLASAVHGRGVQPLVVPLAVGGRFLKDWM